MIRITQIVAFAILILVSAATADVPQMINYQGLLTDDSDQPLEGIVSITFTVYDTADGGTGLWTETHSSVEVNSGIFSVILGSTVPIDDILFNSPNRYLGISVDGDPEISPRTALVTVPYAFQAASFSGSIDVDLIANQCSLLEWAASDISAIYADTASYVPGELSDLINQFAYRYIDSVSNLLMFAINRLEPSQQPRLTTMVNEIHSWAYSDLDEYGAALAAADLAGKEEFDAETRAHFLDRITKFVNDNIVQPVKDWIEDPTDPPPVPNPLDYEDELWKAVDLIGEDIPGYGDAIGKALELTKEDLKDFP